MSEEHIAQVAEYKKETVAKLVEKINNSGTVLVASIRGLPASQFQKIKKKLSDKAEILVAKKSLVNRAIDSVEKGGIKNLKEHVGADVALFFSDVDAFELSGILVDNQSPTRAKAGDIAPEDVNVEPGPTDLMPGPAISELGAVGLKVAVENGKLAIKNSATIVKEGEVIDDKVAGVMGKLGIEPMKVGFIPVAAYDAKSNQTYANIKIDKEGTLAALREAIGKSFGFAVNLGYVIKETIGHFIAKAGLEAMALEKLSSEEVKVEEVKEETEEEKTEEVNADAQKNDKEESQ